MPNNTSDLGSFRLQEQSNTSPRGVTLNADLHPLESFDFGPAAVQAERSEPRRYSYRQRKNSSSQPPIPSYTVKNTQNNQDNNSLSKRD